MMFLVVVTAPSIYHIPKVHIQGFSRICDIDLQAQPGKPPPSFKDHRKVKNPYLSRYGELWVDKLNSSTEMSKLCCITDLIWFMTNETRKLMKGSVNEDCFYRPKWFGVNDSKGDNKLDDTEWVLKWMVVLPQWTTVWDYLLQPSCR